MSNPPASPHTSADRPIERILPALRGVKQRGKGWTALCPAHDDHNASLSIHEGDDSSVLVKCHAGCSFDKVVAAAGLEVGDFFLRAASVPINGVSAAREIAATYDYHDADGRLVFQVVRFKPKDFRQRRPDKSKRDGWAWDLKSVDRVLYKLPELLNANGEVVFIPEGEKDVDALAKLGLVATCNAGGAGKWRPEYGEHLKGRRVVVLADNDDPGRRHAAQVAQALAGVASEVKVLELPDLDVSGDVSDWLAGGHTVAELLTQVGTAAPSAAMAGQTGEPSEASGWRPGCTEMANARRMAANFGSELRYCPVWGSWLCWDGRRWRRDDTKRVWRLARATVRTIYTEAAAADDARERERLAKWAIASESRAALANMIDLASSEPGIPVTPGELDSDPWLFNTLSGTVDLRTGQLREHRSDDLITKIAAAKYDPGLTKYDAFNGFLSRIFAGNADLIGYVQRLLGSSLVGEVRDHILPIAYGTGANGKTTLFETTLHVLGDYGIQAAPNLLIQSDHERHPTEVADLFGVRLIVCREPNRGVRLDEARVKELTGGDTVKARYMRQDFFQFRPSHTAFLIVNHKPVVRGADNAIWRRLKLVPFSVTIPEAEWDTELGAKLRAEAPGILAWLVEGCLAWQRDGLGQPEAVTAATDGYRSEMDAFGAFLAECCVIDKTLEVEAGVLYAAYLAWCEREHERPVSKTSMGLALTERGFERRKSRDRYWLGLGALGVTSGSFLRERTYLNQPGNAPNAPNLSSNGASEARADDLASEQLDQLYGDILQEVVG